MTALHRRRSLSAVARLGHDVQGNRPPTLLCSCGQKRGRDGLRKIRTEAGRDHAELSKQRKTSAVQTSAKCWHLEG
jgi:hypothetical protein